MEKERISLGDCVTYQNTVSNGTLIGIDQLVVGATTSCDLLDLDGVRVIPTGTLITTELLKRIKSSGVVGLVAGRPDYATHHMSVRPPTLEVISSRISEMQRRSGIAHSLSTLTLNFARMTLSDSFRQISSGGIPDLEALDNLVDRIFHETELLESPPLPSPRLMHDTLIDRLVDSAIDMGVLLAWHLRKDREKERDIRAAILGGLLHDSGLVFVPHGIVQREGALTQAEFREIRRHPFLGLRALSIFGDDLPKVARDVILLHHECVDGSGYPLKRKGDCIPTAAKLAHVIDAYAAIVSPRPHRRQVTPHRAIELLLRDSGRKYCREVLCKFVERTGRYPLGSAVVLSSNEVGVVVGVGKGGPFKPVVDVYFSSRHQFSTTPQRIDLGRDRLRYIRQAMT